MKKDIFLYIEPLGNLYIYDVLLKYIYPRIFICEDEYECKYLFYEIMEDENFTKWVVKKIKKSEYYEIIDNVSPVQKFLNEGNLKTIIEYYDTEKVFYEDCSLDDINLISKENYFVKDRKVEEFNKETLDAARESNSAVLDIRFYGGSNRHNIPCNVMSNLCASIQSIFKNIGSEKQEEPLRVSTAIGSCVIRFTFAEQINLFNQSSAIDNLKVFNEIISDDESNESISKVKEKKKFLSAYKRLFNTIKNNNTNVEFLSASANSNDVNKINLSTFKINEHYKNIIKVVKENEEQKELYGKLIAWDVKTKKFKIELLDNKVIISGEINKNFDFEREITVPENYKIYVTIIEKIKDNNFVSELTYVLNNIEK